MHRTHVFRVAAIAVATSFLLACPGDKGAAGTGETATASSGGGAGGGVAGAAEQAPDAGGQLITVKMITDGTSNRFEPATFDAKKGDVIRYVLETGVHNVHFVADSNAGKPNVPTTPGDYLQLPGQTWDVKVNWEPGAYFFQCDPHAVLGMVGRVNVK